MKGVVITLTLTPNVSSLLQSSDIGGWNNEIVRGAVPFTELQRIPVKGQCREMPSNKVSVFYYDFTTIAYTQ